VLYCPASRHERFAATTPYRVQLSGGAFSLPMTKTIEHIIKCFPLLVDSELVCGKCENRKICASCIFSPHYELKGEAAKALDKVTAL
jgi:MoaA/NifB/PqqE/SkfB family radical SAM enzyme